MTRAYTPPDIPDKEVVFVLGTEVNMQMQTYIGYYHQDEPSDVRELRELSSYRIRNSPFYINLINRELSFKSHHFHQQNLELYGFYISRTEYLALLEAVELESTVKRFERLLKINE